MMVQARVDRGDGEGDERCDAGKQGMVNHRDTEYPKRVAAQHAPVGGDKQKPRADERGEEHEDAKIPDAIGIDADVSRDAERQHQREQQAESGNCAVGRDHQRADVEEDWMHLEQG